MLDVPLSVKIEEWRAKAIAGTIATEEMRECIMAIRQGRISASATSAKARAARAPVAVGDLENEIDAL